MSDKFPHIDDTNFPNVENVDVYKYKNNFDYTRWTSEAIIKLLNVQWTSNYDNVVKFDSDVDRDSYFDNLESQSVNLDTIQILQPQGEIKLPTPFDVASRYNYLSIEFPIQTSPTQPIEYESTNGRRRFFYFIKNVIQQAPNATTFVLQLDIWTTFINSCDINYMMLTQGHAPMQKTNVDSYLANPIKNSKYLLADDYNMSQNYITPSYYIESLNTGEMYVCFAITAQASGTWGSEHSDNWQIPESSKIDTQGVPNNLDCFCCKVADYSAFMDYMFNNIPQFYRTIKCIFILPYKMITLSSSFTIGNTTLYHLNATQKQINIIKLTKAMFDFDDKYKDITKLYTFPYSYLEISNSDGRTHQIRIENTNNNIRALSNLNVVAPFLNMEVLFTGIGNDTEKTTQFQNLDTRSFVYSGQWSEYLLRYEIPCYAMATNNVNEFDIDNYWDIDYLRNLAAANRDNDLALNATNQSNAIRTNNANLANGQNNGTLAQNEGTRNASNVTNIGNIQASTNSLITGDHNQLIQTNSDLTNELARAQQAVNSKLTFDTTNSEVKKETMQAIQGAVGGVLGGAIDGIGAGASGGAVGMAIGAGIGMLSSACSAGVQVANMGAAVNCLNEVADANVAASEDMMNNQIVNNSDKEAVSRDNNDQVTNNQNTSTRSVASQNASALSDIGGYRNSTYRTNAANTQTAENANANATKATKDTNANRTYNAVMQGYTAREKAGKLSVPMQYGEYRNGDMQGAKPMNYTYQVNTKSKSEIAQIGDYFLRYGYMLNQNWDFETFNVMRYFTYWRASEIWLNTKDKFMNENHRNKIREILYNGTTIWSDPTKIGVVSIYDNR